MCGGEGGTLKMMVAGRTKAPFMHICDSGLHNIISVTVYTYVL